MSATSVDTRGVARRVIRDLDRHQRTQLVAAAGAMSGSAVLRAVVPLLIGALVAQSVRGHTPSLLAALPGILTIAGVMCLQQAFEVCRRQLVEAAATRVERDNRVRVYDRILRRDLDDLATVQVGALNGRATRSVEGTTKLLKLVGMDFLPSVISALVAVTVVAMKDWRIALVMLGVIPTGFLLTRAQVHNQRGVRQAVRDHKERVDGDMGEIVPVLASVRTVGAEAQIVARVAGHCDNLRATELHHHRVMSLFDAAKYLNEAFWQVLVLSVAVLVVGGGGAAAAGTITTYALLYASVLAPLRELHRIIDEAAECGQQATDFYAMLDAPIDPGFGCAKGNSPVASCVVDDAPAIAVRGLTFGHRERDDVLVDVALEVRAGERVGIVGRSGCGKSTLLRLVRRLHHGYTGSIALFGRDLQSLDHGALSELVGYVGQEPHLIRGTIAENIRLGSPDATDAEVVDAARRAHVADDVLAMPEGFDTHVEERGSTLSGGQRQRICIARALVRRPPMLLMDEPTSALDPVSQLAVQETIDALEDVTVVIVAHRLDTLRAADRIFVVQDGRIAQAGPFAELDRVDGAFRALRASAEAGDVRLAA